MKKEIIWLLLDIHHDLVLMSNGCYLNVLYAGDIHLYFNPIVENMQCMRFSRTSCILYNTDINGVESMTFTTKQLIYIYNELTRMLNVNS